MRPSDIELLYSVADHITTGWELSGSRWQNCEAETIACQVICSARANHRRCGDAFSWQGSGTQCRSGAGLVDNPHGLKLLLDDECIILDPYSGEQVPPERTVYNAEGQPMVIRPTFHLLEYARRMCKVPPIPHHRNDMVALLWHAISDGQRYHYAELSEADKEAMCHSTLSQETKQEFRQSARDSVRTTLHELIGEPPTDAEVGAALGF